MLHFPARTTFFFLIHHDKKESKKEKQCSKDEAKKGEIYKMRNHFSRHRKNQTWKKELGFLRKPTKKETEKTMFFDGKEKRERDFFFAEA